MEFVKSLMPIATFFLGILLTPFVEWMKSRSNIERQKQDVLIEIEDELETIKRSISVVDKSIKKRDMFADECTFLSIPAPVDMMVLRNNITSIYPHLTSDRRKAYKRILLLESEIQLRRNEVLDKYKTSNKSCLASERSMLFSMLSIYYLMNEIVYRKDNFRFPNKSNLQIAKDAADSLGVVCPYPEESAP